MQHNEILSVNTTTPSTTLQHLLKSIRRVSKQKLGRFILYPLFHFSLIPGDKD